MSVAWALRLFVDGKAIPMRGPSPSQFSDQAAPIFSLFEKFVARHGLAGTDGTGYMVSGEELGPFLKELDEMLGAVAFFNAYLREVRDTRRLVFSITFAQ